MEKQSLPALFTSNRYLANSYAHTNLKSSVAIPLTLKAGLFSRNGVLERGTNQ
jgi:hypothetical protein